MARPAGRRSPDGLVVFEDVREAYGLGHPQRVATGRGILVRGVPEQPGDGDGILRPAHRLDGTAEGEQCRPLRQPHQRPGRTGDRLQYGHGHGPETAQQAERTDQGDVLRACPARQQAQTGQRGTAVPRVPGQPDARLAGGLGGEPGQVVQDVGPDRPRGDVQGSEVLVQLVEGATGAAEVGAEHRGQRGSGLLDGEEVTAGPGIPVVGVVGIRTPAAGKGRVRSQRVQAGRVIEQGKPVVERPALGCQAHRPETNSILSFMPHTIPSPPADDKIQCVGGRARDRVTARAPRPLYWNRRSGSGPVRVRWFASRGRRPWPARIRPGRGRRSRGHALRGR